MKISFVIPVLDEAELLRRNLPLLQSLRKAGHQVIVVDGGSRDDSLRIAALQADLALQSEPGRAAQMNHGAQWADGDALLFLHIDTLLPADVERYVQEALTDDNHVWGRFDVQLDEPGLLYRCIGGLMNWRSRLTAVATGDQAIFVDTRSFRQAGGFADLPLMEDVELSKRLRRLSRPACIPTPVTVSARRWREHGPLRTILLMWWLRLLYFAGVPPRRLVRRYYRQV